MSVATRRLRVVVADDEPDMRRFFQEVIPLLGHEVAGVAETGQALVEKCIAVRPDLAVADIKMPDMDGIAAAEAVGQRHPMPFVLVSGHQDAGLLERAASANVMAYLVKPVKPPDLAAAMTLARTRFEQFQAVRKEASDLRQALEDRKVVERAKGALMRRLGVSEEEAFGRLRKLACDTNRKAVEVAQEVIRAEEVFRTVERA